MPSDNGGNSSLQMRRLLGLGTEPEKPLLVLEDSLVSSIRERSDEVSSVLFIRKAMRSSRFINLFFFLAQDKTSLFLFL